MALATFIKQYNEAVEELQKAVEKDCFEQVRRLDGVVSQSFEKIISSEPTSPSEKRMLAEFLLKHLIPEGTGSKINERIRTKIVDLVAAETGEENVKQAG